MQEAKGSAPMIHRLPCTIHHRGPGAISNFFQPQKLGEAKGAEGDEYKANFRGLELKGRTVSIPEGSKGIRSPLRSCFLFSGTGVGDTGGLSECSRGYEKAAK
eukprot:107996-Amorphochlora_amoeboformis.AAC.2